MKAFPTQYYDLHPDEALNYALNRWLPYWNLEETRTLSSQISGYDDWVPVMLDAANKARPAGEGEATAFYFRAAEFFMSWSDDRRHKSYEAYLDNFYKANASIPHTRHQVPYDEGAMPATLLGAETPARGTLVIHGGFDSSMEEFFHMADALRRDGYDVILFDGPGQGGALAGHGLTMPHDWERPVAAVLDHFEIECCALIGISLGGYLALRAAAFEPRISGVIQCDVMEDFRECMLARLPNRMQKIVNRLCEWQARTLVNGLFSLAARREPFTRWALEHAYNVSGAPDAYALLSWMENFNTRTFSHLVTQPVLTMAGTEDHLVPFHQLNRQVEHLKRARSVTARVFSRQEQAHNHCQVGNLGCLIDELRAWLALHYAPVQRSNSAA
jgi:pimeloyl-ACP methyl ester carboxylesterase